MIDERELQEGLPDEELPLGFGHIGLYEQHRLVAKAQARARASRKGNPNARVRKAYASMGDDATLSRWVKTGVDRHLPRQVDLLDVERVVSPALLDKPYVREGRSKFRAKGVFDVADLPHVLGSGFNNAKIGRDVRKGPLRGYWIYTLTLEERATCPSTCHHWATCYGNNMPFAHRVRVDGPNDQVGLKMAIERDVKRLLGVRDRVGILVRLHALGDFFDPRYVAFWSGLLDRYANLATYGYTAWPPDSPVGRAIAEAKARHGRRFAIRWSNGEGDRDCAVPVRAIDAAVNATVCPEQTGRTAACATCGLCWNSDRNVAFLEH